MERDGTRVFRWLIEVSPRPGFPDPEGARVARAIREFGIDSVRSVRASTLYEVAGPLGREGAERAAREVFADPVAERFAIAEAGEAAAAAAEGDGASILTVIRRPGVMDPVVASAKKALRDAGIANGETTVRTARRYRLEGELGAAERDTIERRIIANPVVEMVLEGTAPPPPWPEPRPEPAVRRAVPLDALERVNRERGLALSPAELEAVRAHFRALGRDPTDVELETIAQTWSEHCKHKTLAGAVRYAGPLPWEGDGAAAGTKRYANLLKETIVAATRAVMAEHARAHGREDWFCLSVFVDNAGAVVFDDERAVCMKVETHNHPSALEPYGGAGTGVGGVIRDILGTGLGAKPIANTDVFCVGPPDLPADRVPKGALHPRQVLRGVVAGVRDYGNRMGIPTVSGALYFDERYVGNPLVYCGTVGLIPRNRLTKAPRPGDAIVVAGGRTGRDGIHGATFSSLELHDASEKTASGAVQIGNPIEEKRLLDVLLAARERGLFRAVTDCGAGGLSSAVGEMAEGTGARVFLERVPLKYAGLAPAEIWISEAQERMVLAVPPERLEELLALFASEGVEATAIGAFTGDGRLRLSCAGVEVGELDLAFLHQGLPRIEREAAWEARPRASADEVAAAARALDRPRFDDDILAILSSWNVCSKEPIVRQYDHEVQGTSVLKPYLGAAEDGPGDAAVLAPVRGERRAIAIACGANPRFADLDPYRMAQAAVDEALRNAVAVGADPERAALLDNFSWGDTSLPDRLGSLVLAAEGAARAAAALGAPFISGKDSLNNEFRTASGERIAIPATLLISCLAIVPDAARAVSSDAKRPGSVLYLVGRTAVELGGSHLHLVRGVEGGEVPALDAALARRTLRALHAAIRAGTVFGCHDLAEGGLAVAAAEMAIGGRVGIEIDLAALERSEGAAAARAGGAAALLFAESLSRFLVEVPPEHAASFESLLAGVPVARVGETVAEPGLRVRGRGGERRADLGIAALIGSYHDPLVGVIT